jgi:hypothetical protein
LSQAIRRGLGSVPAQVPDADAWQGCDGYPTTHATVCYSAPDWVRSAHLLPFAKWLAPEELSEAVKERGLGPLW